MAPPEPATLSVQVDGPSLLELPVRDARDGNATPITSDEPEVAAGPPVNPEARDERVRELRFRADGSHQTVDTEVHEAIVAATGAVYRQAGIDIYTIREGEPLSASVRREREVSSESDVTGWSVRVSSEMTCDEADFRITEAYSATEDGVTVFQSERSYRIPRDLV